MAASDDSDVKRVPPPEGYESRLEFAVETFDTRGLWAQARPAFATT